MEKSRNSLQKIQKMKDLGIYNMFLKNSENRLREIYRHYSLDDSRMISLVRNETNRRLNLYNYLSAVLETSFVFSDTPEKEKFWFEIVDELRSEI